MGSYLACAGSHCGHVHNGASLDIRALTQIQLFAQHSQRSPAARVQCQHTCHRPQTAARAQYRIDHRLYVTMSADSAACAPHSQGDLADQGASASNPCGCVLCERTFASPKLAVEHILVVHHLVITKVDTIVNLPA